MAKFKVKRRARSERAELEKFKRELEADEAFKGSRILPHVAGEEKISEAIIEFIEPYRASARNPGAYESLIAVGILAWNAALLPASERLKLLSDSIDAVFSPKNQEIREGLQDLLNLLIRRKEQFFAENRRYILRYHLSKTSEGYHLSVVSTDPQTSGRES